MQAEDVDLAVLRGIDEPASVRRAASRPEPAHGVADGGRRDPTVVDRRVEREDGRDRTLVP